MMLCFRNCSLDSVIYGIYVYTAFFYGAADIKVYLFLPFYYGLRAVNSNIFFIFAQHNVKERYAKQALSDIIVSAKTKRVLSFAIYKAF